MTEQDLLDLYKEAQRQMQRKYKLPSERGIAGMFEDMGMDYKSPEFAQAVRRYLEAYTFLSEGEAE